MTEEDTNSGFTVEETGMMQQVRAEGEQSAPFDEEGSQPQRRSLGSTQAVIEAREEALGVPIEGVRMEDLAAQQGYRPFTMSTAPAEVTTEERIQSISIGRIVSYRSRTGNYTVPAIVNCTHDSIYQPGVEAGFVPPLSGLNCVHLTVFTPGMPGMRTEAGTQPGAEAFVVTSPYPVSENVSGCYQEWDIDYDPNGGPGTWSWPSRTA
jgi:hypothetical protein